MAPSNQFSRSEYKIKQSQDTKPLHQLTAFHVRLLRKFSLFICLHVENNVHILVYTRVYVLHNQLIKIPRQIYFRPSRYRKTVFLGAFAKLRKATISFIMPVCLFAPCKNSTYSGRILMKFEILEFFENPRENSFFLLKSDKNNGHFT